MKMTSKNVAKALPLMALTGMGALVGVHAATDADSKVSVSQETRSEAIPMALLKESTPKACAPGEKEKVTHPGKPGVREIRTKVTTEGGKEISREKVSERIAVMPEAKTVQLCSNTVSRSEQRRSLSGIDHRVVQEILSTTELSLRPGAALTPAEVKQRQEAKEKESKKKAAATPKASPSATPTKKVEQKKVVAPTATQRAQAQASTPAPTKTSSPSTSASASATTSSAPASTAPPITGSKEDWMQRAGIDPKDYAAVDYILFHESGWNYKAVNPSSGAYGLCQALPGNKMASAGADWATNPITQLKWCNEYAEGRYLGWAKAMEAWKIKHWW